MRSRLPTLIAVLVLWISSGCGTDPVIPTAPDPEPTPAPVDVCEIEAVRIDAQLGAKTVGGWKVNERPSLSAHPIFVGDRTGAVTASCPVFTSVVGWTFFPLGLCDQLGNLNSTSVTAACRKDGVLDVTVTVGGRVPPGRARFSVNPL